MSREKSKETLEKMLFPAFGGCLFCEANFKLRDQALAELQKQPEPECKICGDSGEVLPKEIYKYGEPAGRSSMAKIDCPKCKPEPTELLDCLVCRKYTGTSCERGWSIPCSEPDFIAGANEIQCFIERQAAENKRLKEENRWIPVGERLPKKSGDYLTMIKYPRAIRTTPVVDLYSTQDSMWGSSHFHTHWKPIILPEQAKGSE